MTETGGGDAKPIVIKKYANRRLYNTATSSYVTLDDLCAMVKDGVEFGVFDAKTGKDITRSVLTQIIFEQESRGHNLLPTGFLKQLIGYYDDNLRSLVPAYLDMSMQSFGRNQDAMRGYMRDTFGFPFDAMQEWSNHNINLFERTLSMFGPGMTKPDASAAEPKSSPADPTEERQIKELRKQLDDMQKRLAALEGGKDG